MWDDNKTKKQFYPSEEVTSTGSDNSTPKSSSSGSSFPGTGAAVVVAIGAIAGGGYLFRDKISNK